MKIYRVSGIEVNFCSREHAERFLASSPSEEFYGKHDGAIIETELLGYDADPASCISLVYAAECAKHKHGEVEARP